MKSEKEKMLAGDFYNAGDEELVKERDFARDLTFQFNYTKPSEKERRQELLKQLSVAKDIPDNVIAAGNPCRVIRSI